MSFFGAIGREVRITLHDAIDFVALFYLLIRARLLPVHSSRRRIFYKLYRRQIYYTAVAALPSTLIISSMLGGLLVFSVPTLTGGGQTVPVMSELFVNLVMREVAPLACIVILIIRSGSAVTAKIGFLKVFRQFDVLRNMGINPLHIFLVPVFFAFPLSIILLLIYFNIFSLTAMSIGLYSAGYISSWSSLAESVATGVGQWDLTIMFFKGIVSGTVVGLYAVHYGSAMQGSLSHVSSQMSSSMTRMLVTAYSINFIISLLVYQSGGL